MGWIETKENRPMNLEDVLGWGADNTFKGELIYHKANLDGVLPNREEFTGCCSRYFTVDEITHWMPLPEPPKH